MFIVQLESVGYLPASQDPQKLRREIDEWMANYDEKQEEKKRLARETQAALDDLQSLCLCLSFCRLKCLTFYHNRKWLALSYHSMLSKVQVSSIYFWFEETCVESTSMLLNECVDHIWFQLGNLKDGTPWKKSNLVPKHDPHLQQNTSK